MTLAPKCTVDTNVCSITASFSSGQLQALKSSWTRDEQFLWYLNLPATLPCSPLTKSSCLVSGLRNHILLLDSLQVQTALDISVWQQACKQVGCQVTEVHKLSLPSPQRWGVLTEPSLACTVLEAVATRCLGECWLVRTKATNNATV